MASKVSGTIEYINAGNVQHAITASAYGYCTIPANESEKIVDMTGFVLNEGVTVHIKFQYNNTASNPTLNINNTGAKPIVQYGTTAAGVTDNTTGWHEGAIISFTYDGTSWVRDQGFNTNSTYYYESMYSDTAAATAAKVGITSSYVLPNVGGHFAFWLRLSNTAQNKLTLAVKNGSVAGTAKDVYLNGKITSSTNYTWPAGFYIGYYDGTNYHFRTDGKLPGNIAGNAETASSVALSGITNADDLKAIEAITSNTGLLKKTGENTWILDTNSYVTKVSTGTGLTGGDITSTGTIKANLISDTKLTSAASDDTEISERVYAIRVDKNGKLAVNVPWTNINSDYLPLSGGIMTGNIRRYYNAASTEPMITALSNNLDIYLWQIGHGTAVTTSLTNNGYKLLYKGINSSTNNYLQLIATQPNGTETIAAQWDELGNANYTGQAHFNLGTSNTTTADRKFTIQGASSNKLSLGSNGIQAYDNSNTASILNLQYYGGVLEIGSTSTATAERNFYGTFNFKSTNGFTYSGIGTGSDNTDRPIWFSYNGVNGRPVIDTDFKYNPSTNTITIGTATLNATTYTGNASTATTLQTARDLWGNSFDGSASINGNILMGNEAIIVSRINSKTSTGGGWARNIWYVLDKADTNFFRVGIYGSADTCNYMFIGTGTYNDETNIRISPAGVLTLRNTTASTSTSTGALQVKGGAGVTGTVYAGGFNGPLTGNATTATSFKTAQKVYVALNTASTTTTISGGSSNAQVIGVDGVLAISNGGTGKTNDAAINTVFAGPASGSTGAPSWRALVDADIPNTLTLNSITGTNMTINSTGTMAISSTNNMTISVTASSKTMTLSTASTLYLCAGTVNDASILFCRGGTSGTSIKIRLDTSDIFRPEADEGSSLGSNTYKWKNIYGVNIYGELTGNASTATKLSNTPNDTTTFLRGDNTWSNILTGQLKLGSSTQSSAPSDSGIYIHDTRNVTHTPNTWGGSTVQWYCDNGTDDTGRSSWSTIMHVKGFASDYAAHQISFNAANNVTDKNLYHRTGRSTTWETWRTILDSANYSSYAVTAISSTDNVVPRFDGTNGQIQESRMSIDDTGRVSLSYNGRYPGYFKLYNSSGTLVGENWYDTGNTTNVTTGSYNWRQFSPNDTADTTTTGHYETYTLPTVTAGLTGDKTYNIFTSKGLTDNIHITRSGTTEATGYYANNTTHTHEIALIIGKSTGSGGLYDVTNSKWVIYSTIDGTVAIDNTLVLRNSGTRYHDILVKQNNTDNTIAYIRYDSGNATNYTTGRWKIVQFSINSPYDKATTGFAEVYNLPTVDAGLTEDKTYSILTTKTTIATNYGGTGNTTYTAGRVIWAETATKLAGAPSMHINWSAGTTSERGYEELVIGNSTNAGTAGNAFGRLALYSGRTKGSYITAADTTASTWPDHVLPATTGWLVTAGDGSSTGAGSSSAPVFISTSGIATVVTAVDIAHGGTGKTNNAAINTVLAGPASGSAGAPTWRALVDADIPNSLTLTSITAAANMTISTTTSSKTMTLTAASTLYLCSGTVSDASILFCRGGTTGTNIKVRLDTNDIFRPNANEGSSLGSSDYKWKNIYGVNIYGALTGHASLDLALTGGTMSGHIYLGGSSTSGSTANTTQLVFGTSSSQNIAISCLSKALVLNPTTSSTTNQIIFYLEQASIIPKGIVIKNSNNTSITINGGYGTLAGATRSYININNWLNATGVTGAVWNDYAEFRKTNKEAKPGQVVIDNDDGSLSITNKRLMPGAQVVSDTFGFSIGETEEAKTPLAVSGRVLVYTYRAREEYHAGMAVCSAPDGTVDIMTREEIQQYPDAIIGIVSEIPQYEEWGTGKVKVNGRIWIKIK